MNRSQSVPCQVKCVINKLPSVQQRDTLEKHKSFKVREPPSATSFLPGSCHFKVIKNDFKGYWTWLSLPSDSQPLTWNSLLLLSRVCPQNYSPSTICFVPQSVSEGIQVCLWQVFKRSCLSQCVLCSRNCNNSNPCPVRCTAWKVTGAKKAFFLCTANYWWQNVNNWVVDQPAKQSVNMVTTLLIQLQTRTSRKKQVSCKSYTWGTSKAFFV